MKYAVVGTIAALVIFADQLTKSLIRQHIPLYESVVVIPGFFQITHFTNTGGAFGIFSGAHDALRLPFFLTMSMLAVGALVLFLRRVPAHQYVLIAALGGILGGAIGNFIDRALAGEVTDFLYVHWHDYYWPAFNVADSFISTGMVILLGYSLFNKDPADPKIARDANLHTPS